MDGTFHGSVGTGTAEYANTENYYANPSGTYSDRGCTVEDGVTGTMTINFDPWSCSGTGTFERRLTSVYTLDFEGTCDDSRTTTVESDTTTATFTGAMEPCDPIVGCPIVHPGSTDPEVADALMEGTYDQSG